MKDSDQFMGALFGWGAIIIGAVGMLAILFAFGKLAEFIGTTVAKVVDIFGYAVVPDYEPMSWVMGCCCVFLVLLFAATIAPSKTTNIIKTDDEVITIK